MTSLRRILPYMLAFRPWIALMVLTVVLPVAMELLVPRMLQYVIDSGIRSGDMDAIIQGSMVMIAGAVISAIATLGQGLARARLSQGIAFDLRNDLFQHIQSLPFATLDKLRTGGLMTRISSDADVIRMFFSAGVALILRALLMIFGSTLLMLLSDWQLSIIMILCLSVAGVIIWSFMRMASPLFVIVQGRLSSLNTIIQENLAGTHLVKAFVREPHEINRFEASNEVYMQENIKAGRILALVMPILTILTNIGIVAVVWFGGLDVVGGRLTLGELVAFNNYLMIGMTPLLLLGNMVTMASRAEASSNRVLELMATEPQQQAGDAAYRSEAMRGHVVFEDVSFHYDARAISENAHNGHKTDLVLDHVSFEAKPGQRIALLGATGSGKTTLVNLISRFYDTTSGHVRIDDVDVRQWDPESLRSQIGMVMQQTILFSGTVRENIAFGKPEASLDEVMKVARVAQAHDFIVAMPEAYDSIVEARGANLSGGQKQRIAIARALLTAPRILIFDDSTSAVDLETEIKIQDALDQLLENTTTFVIAQRINSVLHADQILVLDSGKIVDTGTHSELMKSSTIYQEIYRSQFGTEDLDAMNVPDFESEQ